MKMNIFLFYISRNLFAKYLKWNCHALQLYGDSTETALRLRCELIRSGVIVVVIPGCFRGTAASYVQRGHKRITLSTEVLLT